MSIARLGLAINVGSDPIEGSVITCGQEPQPFCGWVELAAAIEAVHAGPAGDPGAEPAKD